MALVLSSATNPGTASWVDASTLLTPEANVIEVAKSGAPYATIKAGVDAANILAAAGDRVVVTVAPGIYNEDNPITLSQYVSLVARGGHEVTEMVCLNPGSHGLVLGDNTEVIGLLVADASGAGSAGFYFPPAIQSSNLQDTKIRDCDIGWLSEASLPSPGISTRICFLSEGTTTSAFKCAAGGLMNVEGALVLAQATVTNMLHADGVNSTLRCAGSRINGTLSNRGGYVENGGQLRVFGVYFNYTDTALEVDASGGTLVALGSTLFGTTNSLILGNGAGVTADITGCLADSSKFTIGALADFTGQFTDISATTPGTNVLGELWLGVDPLERVPLTTYTRNTASSGWVSGGEVSTNAGRVLDVTAGEGLINTGTGVVQVTWAATQVTADPTSDFWVYVTSAGTVTIAAAEPSHETTVALATGYANAADIVFVAEHIVPIQHVVVHRHVYTADVIGAIWQSGLATTLPGLLALDVGSGTFYRDETLTTAVGAAPITMITWYNNGAWVPTLAVANVDNANYNNFGVGLAGIPAGEWVKNALYMTVGGDGTQFHLVYGQATYATQNLAEAGTEPVLPSVLVEDGVVLAGVVIQQGAAAVASTTDRRPVITVAGPGSAAAPASHSALADLANDDHLQYLLLNGNAARNPVTGIIDASNGGLTLPLSVAPAQTADGRIVWDSVQKLLTVGDGVTRDTLVSTTAGQILTNKTLVTPTIASYVNATHDHSNAANGGLVVQATEVLIGGAELATQVETDALASDTVMITPLKLGTITAYIAGLSVRSLRTTTGPTDLVVGAVADGQVLARSGATLIGSPAYPPSTLVGANGTITTIVVTNVIATSMTVTPAAGTYRVEFRGSVGLSSPFSIAIMSICVDGVEQASSLSQITRGTQSRFTPFSCVARVTVAGANVITGQWRVSAGTATMSQGRSIDILRVT